MKPHRDDDAAENKNTKEYPNVYFTFAFATYLNPRNLIDGIRNKWEMNGGGKLMVKDLQSHESKVAFVLYFVCTGTPHKYILRNLCSILQTWFDPGWSTLGQLLVFLVLILR